MKIVIKHSVQIVALALVVLTLFVGSQAQIKKSKNLHWNWKKHQKTTINYAKKYLVSDLEPNLPRQSFAKWFRKLVGKEAKLEWQVADCGREALLPGDRYSGIQDFTLCVKVAASMGSDIEVAVFIQFGTLKHGITRDKPIVRFIYVSREDEPAKSADSLTDLSKRLINLIG